LMRTVL